MVLSRSGPAKTLTIKTATDVDVVVDLVPVFDFSLQRLQIHPIIGRKIGAARMPGVSI